MLSTRAGSPTRIPPCMRRARPSSGSRRPSTSSTARRASWIRSSSAASRASTSGASSSRITSPLHGSRTRREPGPRRRCHVSMKAPLPRYSSARRRTMSKSPGHREHPEHKVLEKHLRERIRASAGSELLAESTDVIKVDEDRHPSRYYFPRSDVRMDFLEPSATTTKCPFKGTARYFHVNADGTKLEDAVW